MFFLPTILWNIIGLFFQKMNTPYTGILVNIIKHPYPRITHSNSKIIIYYRLECRKYNGRRVLSLQVIHFVYRL